MRNTRPPREMTFFLPDEAGQSPLSLAEEFMAALPAGRMEQGRDLLSGGVEIRLYYDPEILAEARRWLNERNIIYDVSFL